MKQKTVFYAKDTLYIATKKSDMITLAEKETQLLSITIGSHDGEDGIFFRGSRCLGIEVLYDSWRFIPLDKKTLASLTQQMQDLEDEIVLTTILDLPFFEVSAE